MSKASSATAEQLSNDNGTSSTNSGTVFKKPAIVAKEGAELPEITYIRMGQHQAGAILVEGIYLGAEENKLYAPKLDFKFKTADGKEVVVNEGGNLAYRMKDIAAGTLVRIIYNGKQIMTKGKFKGKPSHNVDVLVAD